MANYRKYKRCALGHMFKHFRRECDAAGVPVKYSNQNIDTSKSYLNYNLAPDRGDFLSFVEQRCLDVHCLNRADVNLMSTWCFTVPKDTQKDEYDLVFHAAYDFMAARYGEENVICAYVHMDETTPHLHFAFVPVVYDEKKKRLTVSSKLLIDKKELQKFHHDLDEAIARCVGRNLRVLTGDLASRKNMSIVQYKAVMATEKVTATNDIDEIFDSLK